MSAVPRVGEGSGHLGESRFLEGAAGTRLHYRAWSRGSPRAALLVLHGLFEHSRRYRELAATMDDAGIATFALDLRGHGASEGRRGHVRTFDLFLEDTARFGRAVADELPDGLPLVLLAHSMGGLIGIRYLEERRTPLAGAIITSPWLALVDLAGWERAMAAVLGRVLPIVPYPSGLDPDDLSHDAERVADYRDDPAIFSTLTLRLAHEVMKAADAAFRRADRVDVPLLFLLAGDDRIVDTSRSLELARSLEGPDVTVEVLEGYYHEVLQEVERTAVLAEIREWIEGRLT